MGSYDKLGELLRKAIETNDFPKQSEHVDSAHPEPEISPYEKEKPEIPPDPRFIKFSKEFEILKLKPTNDLNKIKEAYHRMLKKYHPDNVPKLNLVQKTAAKKTQEVIEAYRLLLSQFSG